MLPLSISTSDDGVDYEEDQPRRYNTPVQVQRPPKFPILLLLSTLIFNAVVYLCSSVIRRRGFIAFSAYHTGHYDTVLQLTIMSLSLIAENIATGGCLTQSLRSNVIDKPFDAAKMLGPALLAAMGDLLYFMAWHNIPFKYAWISPCVGILVLAALSMVILDRRYTRRQWGCHIGAVIGLCLVLSSNFPSWRQDLSQSASVIVGIVCVLMSWLLWSMSRLYLEKILKGLIDPGNVNIDATEEDTVSLTANSSPTRPAPTSAPISMWIRISELSFFCILTMWVRDWLQNQAAVIPEPLMSPAIMSRQFSNKWFLYGFTPLVWVSIIIRSIGDILNIAAIRYVDAVLAEYSLQGGLVVTRFCNMFMFSHSHTSYFELITGLMLFVISTFYYFWEHSWYRAA